MFGWARQTNVDFEVFEAGQHATYPGGYPVAIPKPPFTSGRSMGGSTTGGAFQNDNLRDFYPALMRKHLGKDWEVLNRVGGWTTWHIEPTSSKQGQLRQRADVVCWTQRSVDSRHCPIASCSAWGRTAGKSALDKHCNNFVRTMHCAPLVALRPGTAEWPYQSTTKNMLSVASVFRG